MANQDRLVEEILEALTIKPEDGGSTERRPVHTVGVGATGFFEPSEVAANYCKAPHFVSSKTRITLRFSNGMGLVQPHDGWSDVRGMAVRFHLEGGTDTDLIAMTLPVFFAPDAETFLTFAKDAYPQPCKREGAWAKIFDYLNLRLPAPDPYPGQTKRANEGATAFADKVDWAKPAVLDASQIGTPASYVRAAYHAVHTFIVIGHDEKERYVRFTWQPVAGVLKTLPGEICVDGVVQPDPALVPDPPGEFLAKDLENRLKKGIERFTLMMTIGENGDSFTDSTSRWPLHRRRVMMGTLTLNQMIADQLEGCERLSFNPGLLPDTGIRAADDPVLAIRRKVYARSSERRHAIPCPFAGGKA